jgi:hypothetical protein
MALFGIVLSTWYKHDIAELNNGRPLPLLLYWCNAKMHLEYDFGEQALQIAQCHTVHKRPVWAYTPAYGCLNCLCALSTKGHGKGTYQGAPLPLANICTRSPVREWHRQPVAEDNELLMEQVCCERGDAWRDMNRMLILWVQHGKIEAADAQGRWDGTQHVGRCGW